MTSAANHRNVKLQLNNKGAWRDVLPFDIDAVDSGAVQVAAADLVMAADPSGNTRLRIVIADSLQTALTRWDAARGWRTAS